MIESGDNGAVNYSCLADKPFGFKFYNLATTLVAIKVWI